MSAPITILGGGLMGLAIAHALARRGRPVRVLSRRRGEAAGFVAAGMLAPHAEGLQGNQLELGRRSLELVPEWVATIEADSGMACGLRPCGIVVPFHTAEARDRYATAPFGQALNRSDLKREICGIGSSWEAALLFPQDGQIDNRRRLMRALEAACVARGVSFEEESDVIELICWKKQLHGVRVRRFDGTDHCLACEEAVLTCGAWSAQLLPQLPVFPVKGQMLSLQAPRRALGRVIFGPGTYLVPREDGLVVVGATSEPEAGFEAGLSPKGQKQLEAGLVSLLPEAAQWPPMERWWGFRPCTPDQGPLLGPGPIEGLQLATGHHRNGVLLAAITAQLLAGLMVKPSSSSADQASKPELLNTFRWDRFTDGRLESRSY